MTLDFLKVTDAPALAMLIGIVVFVGVLLSWHLTNDKRFDFRETLVENDRISLSRLGQLTALVVSSPVLLYVTGTGKLSEWLFVGYMGAWAGTYIAAKLATKKADG